MQLQLMKLLGLLVFISTTAQSTSLRYCNADGQTPLIIFYTNPATGTITMAPLPPGGIFQNPNPVGFFICNRNVCGFPTDPMYCTTDRCSSSCSMASLEGRENVFITTGYLGTGLTTFIGAYPLNIYTDSCTSPTFIQAINQQRPLPLAR